MKRIGSLALLPLALLLILAAWLRWRSALANEPPVVISLRAESEVTQSSFDVRGDGVYKVYLELPRNTIPAPFISSFGHTNQVSLDCVIEFEFQESGRAILTTNLSSLKASALAPESVRFLIGSFELSESTKYAIVLRIHRLEPILVNSGASLTVRMAESQRQAAQQRAAIHVALIVILASVMAFFGAIGLVRGR